MNTKRQTEETRRASKDAVVFSVIDKLSPNPIQRKLRLGSYLLSQGELASAELCFDQATKEAEHQQQTAPVVTALIGKAEICQKREAYVEAQELLGDALELADELEDAMLIGFVRQQQGEIATAQGEPTPAFERLKEAMAAFSRRAEASIRERAQVAFKMGLAARQGLRFQDSLAAHREAAALAREAGNDTLAFFATWAQADALLMLGQLTESLTLHAEAEELLDQAKVKNPTSLRSQLLCSQAGVLQASGQLEAADAALKQVQELTTDVGTAARIASRWALLKFIMGRPQQARECESLAIKALDEAADADAEITLNLSKLYLMRGDVHGAERHLTRTLIERPRSSQRNDWDLTFHRIHISLQQGHLATAQQLLDDLRAEIYETDALAPRSSIEQISGNLARLRGQTEDAEACYRKALDYAWNSEMRDAVASALAALAQVSSNSEEEIAESWDGAIAIFQECEAELNLLATSIERQAQAATELGSEISSNLDEIVRPLEQCCQQSQELESLPLELAARTTLGLILLQSERLVDAERHLRTAMEKATQAGMTFSKLLAEGLLGVVLADQEEGHSAETYLGDALREMDELGLEITAKYELMERYNDLTGFWF